MSIEQNKEVRFQPWFTHNKRSRLAVLWEGELLSEESKVELFYTTRLSFELAKMEGIRPNEVFVFTPNPLENNLLIRWQEIGLSASLHPFSEFEKESYQVVKLQMNLHISWCVKTVGQKVDLLVWIKGEYPNGSNGDMEGRFIYYALCMLADTNLPSRILIDLCELNYMWGDGLHLKPPQFIYVDSRIGIIIRPEQKESFSYAMREDRILFSWGEALEKI